MDLVVVGLSRNSILYIAYCLQFPLASWPAKTNVPALAIRSSGLVSHFKKIVLPLTDEVPVRRIKFATLPARTFQSTVYLVSLRKDAKFCGTGSEQNPAGYTKPEHYSPVQCFLLEGKNLAKSTLDFFQAITTPEKKKKKKKKKASTPISLWQIS